MRTFQVSDDEGYSNVSMPVCINDICCLLDPILRKNNISIFVAKIVRFSEDSSEVYLPQLEEVPDSNNLYVLKARKVWKENCNIVYNASESAYKLCTSKQAIFDIVRGWQLIRANNSLS